VKLKKSLATRRAVLLLVLTGAMAYSASALRVTVATLDCGDCSDSMGLATRACNAGRGGLASFTCPSNPPTNTEFNFSCNNGDHFTNIPCD
jgi:hypothetical protein